MWRFNDRFWFFPLDLNPQSSILFKPTTNFHISGCTYYKLIIHMQILCLWFLCCQNGVGIAKPFDLSHARPNKITLVACRVHQRNVLIVKRHLKFVLPSLKIFTFMHAKLTCTSPYQAQHKESETNRGGGWETPGRLWTGKKRFCGRRTKDRGSGNVKL